MREGNKEIKKVRRQEREGKDYSIWATSVKVQGGWMYMAKKLKINRQWALYFFSLCVDFELSTLGTTLS